MDRVYACPIPCFWTIRDAADDERIRRLTFHVSQGDYFPFLATIVGFLKETAEGCASASDPIIRQQAAFAEEVRKDLIYLHEHYQLMKKEVPSVYTTKKVVRF